jgi:hypothetical protein
LDEACFRGNITQVQLLLQTVQSTYNAYEDDPLFNRVFEKCLLMDIQTESLHVTDNETQARQNLQMILHLLTKYGADINANSVANQMSVIHRAALSCNVKMVSWLIARQADVLLRSKKDKMTAAEYAARQGSIYILEDMIREIGMSIVEERDERGRNCLHIASLHGQTTIATFLLTLGMDKRQTDLFNSTPGQLAHAAGFEQTYIVVQGFAYQEPQVARILQYLTDKRNQQLEDMDSFPEDDRVEEDSSSMVSQFMHMRVGATTSLRNAMTYLYRSLQLKSEKL